MRYSMVCSCGEQVFVDALDDDDAFHKLLEAGRSHMLEKEHPDMPGELSDEQMSKMIRARMKKEMEEN